MMKYGHIPGIEKPLSRLVQGTIMCNTNEQEKCNDLLDAVLKHGINTFDTAHGYGNGECERSVGTWINSRGVREQVVILGKGCHHSRDRQRVTPFDISADLHDSLARFKTDYIDLYVLHRDDPGVEVGPIVERLHQHKEEGLIRAYGGSNWSHERVAAANAYAAAHGLTPFAVSSPNFSLAYQAKEPWENCISISGRPERRRGRGIRIAAWRCLPGRVWPVAFLAAVFAPTISTPLKPISTSCVWRCTALTITGGGWRGRSSWRRKKGCRWRG